MIIKFSDFILEGRVSKLTPEEKAERDMLADIGKKKRTPEQEERLNQLFDKASGNITQVVPPSELSLTDLVDYNTIDLQTEYDKMSVKLFRAGIFSELLVKIPIELASKKGVIAFVTSSNGHPVKLTFSKFYKLTYQNFLDTLAHECIHVYTAQRKLYVGLPSDRGHGGYFITLMNKINSSNLGLTITQKEEGDVEITNQNQSLKKPLYVLTLNSKDGLIVKILGSEAIYKEAINDVKFINFLQRLVKNDTIKFYKTFNAYFTKFTVSRSLNSVAYLTPSKIPEFQKNLENSTNLEKEIQADEKYEIDEIDFVAPMHNISVFVVILDNINRYFTFPKNTDVDKIIKIYKDTMNFLYNVKDLSKREFLYLPNLEVPKTITINKVSQRLAHTVYNQEQIGLFVDKYLDKAKEIKI